MTGRPLIVVVALLSVGPACQTKAPTPPPIASAPPAQPPASPPPTRPVAVAPARQFAPAGLVRVLSERERNAYACWMGLGCEAPPRLLTAQDQPGVLSPADVAPGLSSPYGPALAMVLLDETRADVSAPAAPQFTWGDAPFLFADLRTLLRQHHDGGRALLKAADRSRALALAPRTDIRTRVETRAKALSMTGARLIAARASAQPAALATLLSEVLRHTDPQVTGQVWPFARAFGPVASFVHTTAPAFVDVRADEDSALSFGAPPGCFVVDPASQVIVLAGAGKSAEATAERHRALGCGAAASRARAEEAWLVRGVAAFTLASAVRRPKRAGVEELLVELRLAAAGGLVVLDGGETDASSLDAAAARALALDGDVTGLGLLLSVDAQGLVIDRAVAALVAVLLHHRHRLATESGAPVGPAFLDAEVARLSQAGLWPSLQAAAAVLKAGWPASG